MPKLLTITGMAVSVIILLLFLVDLIPVISVFGDQPAKLSMGITFIVCAAILGYLSWSAYREIQ